MVSKSIQVELGYSNVRGFLLAVNSTANPRHSQGLTFLKGGWGNVVSIATQSVQALNPSGGEILLTFPEQPKAYPASCSLSTGSLSWSIAARACSWPPTPFQCQGCEWVDAPLPPFCDFMACYVCHLPLHSWKIPLILEERSFEVKSEGNQRYTKHHNV